MSDSNTNTPAETTDEPGTDTPPPVQDSGTDTPAPADEAAGTGGAITDDPATWPEAARKKIADLNREAAGHRAKKNEAETQFEALKKEFGKKFGFLDDDAPPSVDDLTQSLTKAQEQLRAAKQDAAVSKALTKLGIDPSKVEDSKRVEQAITALDQSQDDYSEQVLQFFTKALEADPSLKTAPAAGTGGTDLGSTPGTGVQPEKTGPEYWANKRNKKR